MLAVMSSIIQEVTTGVPLAAGQSVMRLAEGQRTRSGSRIWVQCWLLYLRRFLSLRLRGEEDDDDERLRPRFFFLRSRVLEEEDDDVDEALLFSCGFASSGAPVIEILIILMGCTGLSF